MKQRKRARAAKRRMGDLVMVRCVVRYTASKLVNNFFDRLFGKKESA